MTPTEAGYPHDGVCACGEEYHLVDEQERIHHDGAWVIAEARCSGMSCPPMLLQMRSTLADLKKKRRNNA